MQTIIVLALFGVFVSRTNGNGGFSQFQAPPLAKIFVPIVKLVGNNNNLGEYNFDSESGDGTKLSETGSMRVINGEAGAVKKGQVSWTSPEGQQFSLNYIADENGFQPVASHLPVPPPAPEAPAPAAPYAFQHHHQQQHHHHQHHHNFHHQSMLSGPSPPSSSFVITSQPQGGQGHVLPPAPPPSSFSNGPSSSSAAFIAGPPAPPPPPSSFTVSGPSGSFSIVSQPNNNNGAQGQGQGMMGVASGSSSAPSSGGGDMSPFIVGPPAPPIKTHVETPEFLIDSDQDHSFFRIGKA